MDYLTPDELEALKAELKPADGLPGKDGKDANTQDIIRELLANEVFLLYTKAKITRLPTFPAARRAGNVRFWPLKEVLAWWNKKKER